MNHDCRKDFVAAVPLRSLYHQDGAPEPSNKDVFDYLPMGVDEGAAKLVLFYKGASLARRCKAGMPIDEITSEIAEIAQRLADYEVRSQSLTGSFAKAVKRYASKGLSFLSENSAIFGSAAAGALVAGGTGGIVASAAVTYPQVFGASFLEEIKKQGCDLRDVGQIRAVLADEAFVQDAYSLSRAHAAKMSAAVFGAGVLAGYVYSSVAKPVAQMGTNVARSLLSSFTGAARESGAKILGDMLAEGVKSVTNGAAKRAIQAIPSRALMLTGVVYEAGHELAEHMEEGHDLICPYGDADYGGADCDGGLTITRADIASQFPSYNSSLLYI